MSRPNKLIQFYLTNICNSHCRTCEIWKNRRVQEIPFEKVVEIVKQFPDADYVFGGGEFTLYSQRYELLTWCDWHNVKYTVLSNAVNLKLLEQLLVSYNIKNLTMSCDGTKHDEIRGVKGNLKNIETIVKNWKDKIPNIKLSYTLSSLNEDSIDEDMAYFKKLGFNKIYFCIAQNMDLLKTNGNIVPSKKAIEKIYNEYSDMLYDKDIQLLQDILIDNLRECDSTDSVHTIYSNGDVVRCQSYMSDNVLGNIFDTDFAEILIEDAKRWKYDVEVLKEHCPYEKTCQLVCQRRYDYEDRL